MSIEHEYSQGIIGDGAAILKDGQPMTIEEILLELQKGSAPEGWKPVPIEPTEAMIEAASDAYMPFGDMDLAIRCAILAAPQPPAEQKGNDHD